MKSVRFHRTRPEIRFAEPSDAEAIYSLGISDSSFQVSPIIRFYEKTEIEQWSRERDNNILLVAEAENEIIGFLYCKIMSHHWAMLDNFYIRPESRNRTCSEALWNALLKELKARQLTYLTCLVREDHKPLARLLRQGGFIERNRYVWFELFL
jgi:ribosomal protein S18 acetylase RimI-like enzyme